MSGTDIWESIDYSADFSDEETIISLRRHRFEDVESTTSTRSSIPDSAVDLSSLVLDVDESALDAVKSSQRWRDQLTDVTELQETELLREILQALHGLPSALFLDTAEAGIVKSRPGVFLADCTETSVYSMLERAATLASHVNTLRLLTHERIMSPLLQAFISEVENELRRYDEWLARAEQDLVDFHGPTIVSALSVLDEAENAAEFLMRLSNFVKTIIKDVWQIPHRLLDRLYDICCDTQLEGNDHIFERFVGVLIKCLEAYMKPIEAWMARGSIDHNQDSFCVQINNESGELSSLWHDRYTLRAIDGSLALPFFLRPFSNSILAAGKSVAMVERLGLRAPLPDESGAAERHGLHSLFQDSTSSLSMLPFAETLRGSLAVWVQSKQSRTWPVLRSHLMNKCHLMTTLDAFHAIFLSSNGTVFDEFLESAKSQLQPNSREAAIESLARTSLVEHSAVKTRFLTVTLDHEVLRKQGVRRFEGICMAYATPWSVANILRPASLRSYQRCFHLIFQLKSAIHALGGLRMRPALLNNRTTANRFDLSALRLRHRLWYVLYTILTHVTQQIIYGAFIKLQRAIQDASSFDAMINAHDSFIRTLDAGTLHILTLRTARGALISICNIAMAFSARYSGLAVDASQPPSAVRDGGSLRAQDKQGQNQLEQLLVVLVGDLRAATRSENAANEAGWEALAAELDWKREESA